MPTVAWTLDGFLCIACSDLLPELHFHSHDRVRLSSALLAGLATSILVGAFEGHAHSHENVQGAQPVDQHNIHHH